MNLSYAITAAVAVMALISPVIVAIVNNRHQLKLRQLEIEFDKVLDQATRFYSDKKISYSNLIECACNFTLHRCDDDSYEQLLSAINDAHLYSSKEVSNKLNLFLDTVNDSFVPQSDHDSDVSNEDINNYSWELFKLSEACREDLESSKPKIK